MAYNDHVIGPHCPIGVRRTMTVDGVSHTAVVESTPCLLYTSRCV